MTVTAPRRLAGLSRAEKVALIERVRAERPDLTGREKAALIGMNYSGYLNLLSDPDGSKQRARREGYAGACEVCGEQTRSDGTSRPSRLCVRCAQPEKRWTREAIIAAIQRWAAEHGQPPTADDWLHADPDGRWPNRANVYQSPTRQSAPFAAWADAIEAAGFPRPIAGYWQNESARSERFYELYEANPRFRLGKNQVALLEALGRRSPQRLSELASGRDYDCTKEALKGLLARGLVVRIKRGTYAATDIEAAA